MEKDWHARRRYPSGTVLVPFLPLAALFVATFFGTLSGTPIWDDVFLLKADSKAAWGESIPLPGQSATSYWRPLAIWTIAILGENHFAQHLLHLSLGLALAGSFCALAACALPEEWRKPLPVFLCAAPFALHPALVSEPVAWMAGRFDLMLATFLSWSLVAALRGTGRAAAVFGILALCAMLSKDNAVFYVAGVVPVAFLALNREAALRVALAAATAAAAWLALRVMVLPTLASGVSASSMKMWSTMPLEALGSLAFLVASYAAAIAIPWSLAPLPDGVAARVAGLVMLSASLMPFFMLIERRSIAVVALCGAFAPLLVSLGVMAPIRLEMDQALRYLLPSTPFAVLAASVSFRPARLPFGAAAAGCSAVLALAWFAHSSVVSWNNPGAFWTRQTVLHPESVGSWFNLAKVQLNKGDFDGAETAISEVDRIVAASLAHPKPAKGSRHAFVDEALPRQIADLRREISEKRIELK